MQLLATRTSQGSFSVNIPPSVLEELIAHQRRESEAATRTYAKAVHALNRLGFRAPAGETLRINYRAYLLERFEEVLSFVILDWPKVSHETLVDRAVYRVPPFDSKGGGYRDSLVWMNVLELVKQGREVVFVSADRGFANAQGELHSDLVSEIDALPGSVILVRDLSAWLLSTLPAGSSLIDAVQAVRDQEFADFYFQSDIQSDLFPSAADIGFSHRPIRFELDESEWGGDIRKVSAVTAGEGVIVAEYDVDQIISFRVTLPEGATIEPDWEIEGSFGNEVNVLGRVDMVVRIAVLFDADMSFAIDELSWRRADGTPAGLDFSTYRDPSSVPLF